MIHYKSDVKMKNNLEEIVSPLLEWFQKEKRDLPWRHTKDSYKIWISEIMLQQTRVEAVKEYYQKFIKELPTIKDLAEVDENKLLKLWEGLGYYSRARNLKKCAQTIIEAKKTSLPSDYEELMELPGIGPYAAGSISSIAYGKKNPAIDGNVLRVMTRIFEDDRDIMNAKVRKDYFEKLQEVMPDNTRDFTESLMELGALVCLPNGLPLCEVCPLSFLCQSYKHQTMLDYPTKKKESKRKIEEKTIIILEHNGQYAIQKRPSKGLLASMYEFINLEGFFSEKELIKWLKEQKIVYEQIEDLGNAKHIFSHLEWHMKGFLIICKKNENMNFIWANKKEFIVKCKIINFFT